MQTLCVYADFDWLDKPQLMGELSCDTVRDKEIYGFSFDRDWLAKYGEVFYQCGFKNFTKPQYTQVGSDLFACFVDALRDGWGRTLFSRREQIVAAEEKRPLRRINRQHR